MDVFGDKGLLVGEVEEHLLILAACLRSSHYYFYETEKNIKKLYNWNYLWEIRESIK